MHSKQRGDDDGVNDNDEDFSDDVYDNDDDDDDADDVDDDDPNSGNQCTRNKVAIGDGKAAPGWKQNTGFFQKYKYKNANAKKFKNLITQINVRNKILNSFKIVQIHKYKCIEI